MSATSSREGSKFAWNDGMADFNTILYGRILFWSAVSCGSELIVGAFVQERHQIGFSRGNKLASQTLGISKYIQDVSWMAVSYARM